MQGKAGELIDRLTGLAVDDEAAYDCVVDAFRMPRFTEGEALCRREAIQLALRRATDVPMKTARACFDVLRLADQILDKINPNALSDVGTAAALAEAGLQGARMNVIINCAGLGDPIFADSVICEVDTLLADTVELRSAVFSRFDRGAAGK